jgi:hypothetical protein
MSRFLAIQVGRSAKEERIGVESFSGSLEKPSTLRLSPLLRVFSNLCIGEPRAQGGAVGNLVGKKKVEVFWDA